MADFKAVNIREIERRRDEIVQTALTPFFGQTVNIDSLAAALRDILPEGIPRDAVFESIRYLAGHPIVEVEAIRLAWRLAGNIPTLKEGHPAAPWSVQRYNEWVPLQVLRVIKTRNSKNKIGFEITTRVLAGTPSPMKINSFWSPGIVRFVAMKVGFSKSNGSYPFRRAEDLVGLRFYGLVEPARSRTRPEFHEVECPDSVINWNRANVLKTRIRVNGTKCPANYIHACHVCAIGYDRCDAAMHAKTYTIGFCPACGKNDVAFDPEENSPHCVNCNATERLKRRS